MIAYSTCIEHGIDRAMSMTHQKDAVRSGYWPLYRWSSEEEHEPTVGPLPDPPAHTPQTAMALRRKDRDSRTRRRRRGLW